MSEVCQFLAWDSDFFGSRVARINSNKLAPQMIPLVWQWCETHEINCLYFLADANDAQTVHLAEANNFQFVDIRFTLEMQLRGGTIEADQSIPIRLSTLDDIPALRDMARLNHRDTRFYFDPQFSWSHCDALYETWIEQSCRGYADVVLVPHIQDRPAGYLSCHLRDQNQGQIGLFGIDAAYRGRGLGQELVKASLNWFSDRGVTQITVVTQGRNIGAQRLYQRCGFVTQKLELWYHRWLT